MDKVNVDNYTKEDKKKKEERYIKAILSFVNRGSLRQKKIKDPVTRHTLFVEKISMLIDFCYSMLELRDKHLSPGLLVDIEKTIKNVDDDLNSLIEWIQQPIYSPNHPIGNKIMKEAEKRYEIENKKNEK